MARKKKVGRPPGRAKPKLLSVRVSQQMRDLLAEAAWKSGRTLSAEVEARLDDSLGRYQKFRATLPPRIKGLADAVVFAISVIENATGRLWNEDQYTSEHLARSIEHIIAEYTLPGGKSTIPARVLEKAKTHIAGNAYPARLGEEEAKGIIAWFRLTPPPQQGVPYSEYLAVPWKIGRDLEPKRKK
jgi:hypothetical protein